MNVVVDLTAMTICFLGSCHPVLAGKNTPKGEFDLIQRYTLSKGYGGDVLQFDETPTVVLAIHRVWLGRPQERREDRLKSQNLADRMITNGCINVEPAVYEKLVDCCSNGRLTVK